MDFEKTILITGCAGFIGANLTNYLKNKYPQYRFIGFDIMAECSNIGNIDGIFAATKTNFEFVKGDIRKKNEVLDVMYSYGVTDIIHLAAETHVDNSIMSPLKFVQTNVFGTATLLEVARDLWQYDLENHRFYLVSTDEVYGSLNIGDAPFTEDSRYDPHSPYAASKASADHLVQSYHDTYGMNTVISNCSNNYGIFQYPEKLIPKAVKCLVYGEDIPIYGKGLNIRDWLSVKDHCTAIDTIFHNAAPGSRYNVGGNNEMTNNQIIDLITKYYYNYCDIPVCETLPWKYVEDRKGHDFRYAIDSSKLQRELGWRPQVDFESELKEVVEYYIELFRQQKWIMDNLRFPEEPDIFDMI